MRLSNSNAQEFQQKFERKNEHQENSNNARRTFDFPGIQSVACELEKCKDPVNGADVSDLRAARDFFGVPMSFHNGSGSMHRNGTVCSVGKRQKKLCACTLN